MIYFHKGDFMDGEEVIGGQRDGTEFYYHMLCDVDEIIKNFDSSPKLDGVERETKDVVIALHHLKRALEDTKIGNTGYKIGDVQ